MTGATTAPDELLLGFARALRAAGLPVTSDRARTFVGAVSTVGLDDRRATYWAGRATLCSAPEHFPLYDRVFTGWFLQRVPRSASRSDPLRPLVVAPLGIGAGERAEGDDDVEPLSVAASDAEVLQHRDIATLDAAERARLTALFGRLHPVSPTRVSYRRRPARRGVVDAHRTLRRTLDMMGEPGEIAWRHRSSRRRRTVILLDVSGSMSSYADALLRLAHRISSTGEAEVFSVGTRVTRITRAMRLRDPDRALVAAGETVPDWSGGTRLGEGLKVFLDRWGRRGLARGAVVVIVSDGWERGDAVLLGEQMERLHRLAHRVVWANPHKASAGYLPVQLGMAAALPHVDDFVAGHSLAAFRELLEVIRDA